ncbi:hypothetical protein AMTR_s00005p00242130 [Amborella trichopoda]|uniref:Uncharacterized protein n=1 Tax=Amborella trichopoda TaxID=13333 RepID=W1PGM8_AMBTC|nr:hypothetical protein AMTR_s00005p00242130 [Amborella trichopoda]
MRFQAMAEAGSIPNETVDDEEDGAYAWNFEEEDQWVNVFSFQEEQDQAKNQEIYEIRAQKEQEEVKNQEIEAQDEREKAKNREIALSNLLRNLQLVKERFTSELEIQMKRIEELERQLEEATGAGRNDQPDVEGANPEPQEPYFHSPF